MRRQQAGFTIVETLIVIAIAGLILLSVFLILPATQRSSRNTQRRTDMATILAAIGKYQSDHLGGFPDNCGSGGSNCSDCTPTPPAQAGFLCDTKLRFYDPVDIAVKSYSNYDASNSPIAVSDAEHVILANYHRCDDNSSTTNGAAPRDTIAIFNVEIANSATGEPQCLQL